MCNSWGDAMVPICRPLREPHVTRAHPSLPHYCKVPHELSQEWAASRHCLATGRVAQSPLAAVRFMQASPTNDSEPRERAW